VTVYSFRGERLAEHSYLTLRLYLAAFGDRHERVLAAKLASEGVKLDEVRIALRASFLLHDVGKALRSFQRQFRSCGLGEPRFPYHEALSAYLVYETLLDCVRQPLAIAASLAALQHHQAMRSPHAALEEMRRRLELRGGVDEAVVNEIELAVEILDSEELRAIAEALSTAVEKFNEEPRIELREFTNVINSWMTGCIPDSASREDAMMWRTVRELIPTFTGPLQVADAAAAALVRRGQLRRLGLSYLRSLLSADTSRL